MTTSPALGREARLPRTFRSMTMAEGLRAAAARDPAKIVAVCGDDRRTFGDLIARIERAANATVGDLGLKKGQTAAIISRNCIEYLEITCGLPHAGVAVATVNAKLTVGEAAAICDDAGARVLFVDETWAPRLTLSDFATVKRIIALGADYEAWLATGETPAILAAGRRVGGLDDSLHLRHHRQAEGRHPFPPLPHPQLRRHGPRVRLLWPR